MVKLLRKLIQETRNKLNSTELFEVDRKLMIFLGCWPENFSYKKLIAMFCVLFVFDFLPKLNFFIKQILDLGLDPQSFALSCTEFIMISLSNIAIIIFIYHRKTIDEFFKTLNINWFKVKSIENPEWHKIRSETAMFSNRIAWFVKCALYASTFIYCIVPLGIFFIKYYILKMNVQKVTSTSVE